VEFCKKVRADDILDSNASGFLLALLYNVLDELWSISKELVEEQGHGAYLK